MPQLQIPSIIFFSDGTHNYLSTLAPEGQLANTRNEDTAQNNFFTTEQAGARNSNQSDQWKTAASGEISLDRKAREALPPARPTSSDQTNRNARLSSEESPPSRQPNGSPGPPQPLER
jgi:hypothetical protein